MITPEQAIKLMLARVEQWSKQIALHLPDLALAILAYFFFRFVGRWVRGILVRNLNRVSDNPALTNLIGTLVQLGITATGLFIGLGLLGLDKTVTSLLAGAGVLALAVGFAFQDLTTNFISGTLIALQRPIEVGDVVDTNGFTGRVISVNLRSIVLDNFAGQTIEIPSKDVFQKPIVNYSRTGERRVEITANVSYVDDLDRAQQVAQDAISVLPFVLTERSVDVFFRQFTGEAVQFVVQFWIDATNNQPASNVALAQSEAMKALKTAFEANDLLLMFPPHTFDLKKRLTEEHSAT